MISRKPASRGSRRPPAPVILLLVAAACCLAPPRRRLLGAAAAFVPRRPTSVGGRAAVAFGGGASRSSAGAAIGDDAAAAAAVVRSNEGTALASLDSLTGAMAERATGLLSRLGGENNADNAVVRTDKDAFLASLDTLDSLNDATKERTGLLNSLIENKNEVRDLARPSTSSLSSSSSSSSPSLERPGSVEAFMDVAPGTWSVVYAPHMTTMAGLVGGSLGVEYDLRDDGTVISHARYDVPLFGQRGYLSVSGTYGSEDGADVCRVDFDEAWVRPVSSSLDGNDGEDEPYPTVGDVPDSFVKGVIRTLGRAAFIKEVSVFPVSFLDDDLIVFDFELLGTRICARKML